MITYTTHVVRGLRGAIRNKQEPVQSNDMLKETEQAGAELGQAQLKLGFDFTLIFCKFGSSTFGLVKLFGWI